MHFTKKTASEKRSDLIKTLQSKKLLRFPGAYNPLCAKLIAEIGINHNGDLDLAKRLIDEAKEGGADAIKFQTYKASTLASKNSPAYWDLKQEKTTSQYALFSKYDNNTRSY